LVLLSTNSQQNISLSRAGPAADEKDMADHCPKCGATVTGHYAICVVCDAIVGDPASVPPVAAWIPPSSRAKQLRARITFVALPALVALGIAFGIWRAAKTTGIEENAPAPIANSRPASIGATGLGVDIYPGAHQQQLTTRRTATGSATTGTLTTSDSLDKVVNFYETRLGAPFSQNQQSDMFAASSKDRKTTVMLTVTAVPGGTTRIGILHSNTR
jgi:hypothetical protein